MPGLTNKVAEAKSARREGDKEDTQASRGDPGGGGDQPSRGDPQEH